MEVEDDRAAPTIQIPLRDGDEFVEIDAREPPESAGDLLELLRAEAAPLRVWVQCAVRFGAAATRLGARVRISRRQCGDLRSRITVSA